MKNWIKTNSFPLAMALFCAILTTIFIIFSPFWWSWAILAAFTVGIVLWAARMKAENDPVWFWQDEIQVELLWIGFKMALPIIVIFGWLLLVLSSI